MPRPYTFAIPTIVPEAHEFYEHAILREYPAALPNVPFPEFAMLHALESLLFAWEVELPCNPTAAAAELIKYRGGQKTFLVMVPSNV